MRSRCGVPPSPVPQVTNGTYDLEVCLALLRLYNFDPDTVNVSLLASVLLKALTQLPELDFSLMLHLIPERFQVRICLTSAQVLVFSSSSYKIECSSR